MVGIVEAVERVTEERDVGRTVKRTVRCDGKLTVERTVGCDVEHTVEHTVGYAAKRTAGHIGECVRDQADDSSIVRRLSDTQLLEHADVAVRRHRRSGLAVVTVLAEIDRRSLYLDQGYSSLYDYCTRRWHYSVATAARFIAAARAVVRFPSIRRLLEERQLTICAVARLAKSLTPDNCDDLLSRAAGRTSGQSHR